MREGHSGCIIECAAHIIISVGLPVAVDVGGLCGGDTRGLVIGAVMGNGVAHECTVYPRFSEMLTLAMLEVEPRTMAMGIPQSVVTIDVYRQWVAVVYIRNVIGERWRRLGEVVGPLVLVTRNGVALHIVHYAVLGTSLQACSKAVYQCVDAAPLVVEPLRCNV